MPNVCIRIDLVEFRSLMQSFYEKNPHRPNNKKCKPTIKFEKLTKLTKYAFGITYILMHQHLLRLLDHEKKQVCPSEIIIIKRHKDILLEHQEQ